MSVIEANTLDMAAVLVQAYEVGDMIKSSVEMADYLYWKQRKDSDPEAQKLLALFQKKKAAFEDCERFGHFHPDYHAALEAVQEVQDLLDEVESVKRFRQAEAALDEMLHSVSSTIAYAVSQSVKVPSNSSNTEGGSCSSGGCSSGGGCSGGCG